jgi:hypothetical protein
MLGQHVNPEAVLLLVFGLAQLTAKWILVGVLQHVSAHLLLLDAGVAAELALVRPDAMGEFVLLQQVLGHKFLTTNGALVACVTCVLGQVRF